MSKKKELPFFQVTITREEADLIKSLCEEHTRLVNTVGGLVLTRLQPVIQREVEVAKTLIEKLS
ncbi:MAG: hypothetical protein K2X93_00060 [Candidatus Obscuribacterales bacterium]|nr:hypothetical protein [Candidatus Obscuribacterales bacterium]